MFCEPLNPPSPHSTGSTKKSPKTPWNPKPFTISCCQLIITQFWLYFRFVCAERQQTGSGSNKTRWQQQEVSLISICLPLRCALIKCQVTPGSELDGWGVGGFFGSLAFAVVQTQLASCATNTLFSHFHLAFPLELPAYVSIILLTRHKYSNDAWALNVFRGNNNIC